MSGDGSSAVEVLPTQALFGRRRFDGVGWAIAGGLVTFAAAFFLYTRANHFPYTYHPDEPSKAEQVATGRYNFNHPQLVLRAAEAMALIRTGDPRGRLRDGEPVVPHFQRIVNGGREASAAFGAAAAAALAALAWRVRGPAAGAATGIGLAVFAPLLAAAHFLKEDTVLVFTVAIWLIAAAWYLRRRSWRSVVGFGLACGLALCGKWVGGVLTVAGLALVARVGLPNEDRKDDETKQVRRIKPAAAAAAAASAAVLLVNLPALWQIDSLLDGWRREATHVATGHEGLILPRLPVYAGEVLALGPVVLGLAALELLVTARRPERRWPGWWLMPALIVGWIALVTGSRVVTPRYVLPSVVLLVALAGMGFGTLMNLASHFATRRFPVRRRELGVTLITGAVLLGLWLVPHGLTSLNYLRQFRRDTRDDARAWLAANLPTEGRLVYDNWTGVRPWQVPMPAEMRPLPLATATPEELAAEGFTHLAIADRSYQQYFVAGVQAAAGKGATMARVRERYGRLLAGEGNVVLLAEFVPDTPPPTHMSPRVRVYRLSRPTSPPPRDG